MKSYKVKVIKTDDLVLSLVALFSLRLVKSKVNLAEI